MRQKIIVKYLLKILFFLIKIHPLVEIPSFGPGEVISVLTRPRCLFISKPGDLCGPGYNPNLEGETIFETVSPVPCTTYSGPGLDGSGSGSENWGQDWAFREAPNISRQLANLLAPRVRWRQDSEVRDCVARLMIGVFEHSRRI